MDGLMPPVNSPWMSFSCSKYLARREGGGPPPQLDGFRSEEHGLMGGGVPWRGRSDPLCTAGLVGSVWFCMYLIPPKFDKSTKLSGFEARRGGTAVPAREQKLKRTGAEWAG